MYHLLFHSLLLYFLIFASGALSLNNVVVRDLGYDDTMMPERHLRAAKRSNQLSARDVEGCLRHDHDLHYLDGKYDSSHHYKFY